jgi:DNA-binding transcriptional regulator GbsR (MarR family)
MSDKIQSSESQSPEHISLEKRFGITEDDFSHELADKTEEVWEKSTEKKEKSYADILSKVKSDDEKKHDEDTIMQDASTLHQQADRESQLTHLVDLAMTKGVGYAVKVAKKSEDNYDLDRLHDKLLSDELHDKLVSQGVIIEK